MKLSHAYICNISQIIKEGRKFFIGLFTTIYQTSSNNNCILKFVISMPVFLNTL
jgi:hypothetical protein